MNSYVYLCNHNFLKSHLKNSCLKLTLSCNIKAVPYKGAYVVPVHTYGVHQNYNDKAANIGRYCTFSKHFNLKKDCKSYLKLVDSTVPKQHTVRCIDSR